jgi:hypothetical protein
LEQGHKKFGFGKKSKINVEVGLPTRETTKKVNHPNAGDKGGERITVAMEVAKVATSLLRASIKRLVSNPVMFVLQTKC